MMAKARKRTPYLIWGELILVSLMTLLLIGLGANAYSRRVGLAGSVEVVAMKDPHNTGFVTRMAVRVVNHGPADVTPMFTVLSLFPLPVQWEAISGPSRLSPGSTGLYQIDSAPDTALEVGGGFVVRVNDMRRHMFIVSRPMRATLENAIAITDPAFTQWVTDPEVSQAAPLGWQLVGLGSSVGPNLGIARAIVAGRPALAYRIRHAPGNPTWQGLSVQQTIQDSGRVAQLFAHGFSISVYPILRDMTRFVPGSSGSPGDVFGIQIYADGRLLWIMFFETESDSFVQRNAAVIVLHAPLSRWSSHFIDLAAIYRQLAWPQPDELIFSLLAGTAGETSGSGPAIGGISLGSPQPTSIHGH